MKEKRSRRKTKRKTERRVRGKKRKGDGYERVKLSTLCINHLKDEKSRI